MIKQITDKNEIEFEVLAGSHYGRRFRALFQAYGTGYDFCRFYEIFEENISAYFVVLNSSMTVAMMDIDGFDLCEFSMFVEMNRIAFIEMPLFLAEKISLNNYIKTERVLFGFQPGDFSPEMVVNEKPELDEVFKIVKTGFTLKDCYELWLTDTSHQIRHGISKLFLYYNTTAAMYYNVDGIAFFGQIATAPADRGKGYARELLYWLGDKMLKNGISAQLFAKPDRVSFYKAIGFKVIDRDIVFERNIK